MAATMTMSLLSVRSVSCVLLFFSLFSSSIGATPYKYFSTKTPYEWVHQSPSAEPIDDEWYYLKELYGMSCSAVHANAVIRHGARFPGLQDVNEISNIHEKIMSKIDLDINPDLYNWVNKFPSNDNKALSPLGEVEQEALGRRYAKKLSTLFADEDPSSFRFIVSSKERTKQSASAFYDGFASAIYGAEDAEEDFDTEVDDTVLRFFTMCAKYVYSVENNKTAFKEYHDFLAHEKMVQIKEKVHRKLDITEDILTTANIRLIYLVCGYETAVYHSSPWCSLLDENDMMVLEYLGDLKHYYKNGFGHQISWQQSCPLVSEIFSTMDETIMDIENSNEDEAVEGFLVGQFAFGHAETLGPLYAALGLFNDSEPLKADNFHKNGNRLFRTSEILPFSGNIMFILYECVSEEFGEDDEIDEAEYYLKMLVNEKPRLIPGCEELHCPYRAVREHYRDLVDFCDFKKICEKPVVTQRDEL